MKKKNKQVLNFSTGVICTDEFSGISKSEIVNLLKP